jgi:hypothetical protein
VVDTTALLVTGPELVELEDKMVGWTIGGAVTVGGTTGARGLNHFITFCLFLSISA